MNGRIIDLDDEATWPPALRERSSTTVEQGQLETAR
jgi:hypothetical protein